MKKIIALTSMVYLLSGVSAYAGIIIQPTIIEAAPQPVMVAQPAYAVPAYPVHVDRNHHNYNWRYWQERQEREKHEHIEHEEHGHR